MTNYDWYLFDLDNLEPRKLNVDSNGSVTIKGFNYYSFILSVPNSSK